MSVANISNTASFGILFLTAILSARIGLNVSWTSWNIKLTSQAKFVVQSESFVPIRYDIQRCILCSWFTYTITCAEWNSPWSFLSNQLNLVAGCGVTCCQLPHSNGLLLQCALRSFVQFSPIFDSLPLASRRVRISKCRAGCSWHSMDSRCSDVQRDLVFIPSLHIQCSY